MDGYSIDVDLNKRDLDYDGIIAKFVAEHKTLVKNTPAKLLIPHELFFREFIHKHLDTYKFVDLPTFSPAVNFWPKGTFDYWFKNERLKQGY